MKSILLNLSFARLIMAASLLALPINASRADELHDFVHMDCLPEFDYFNLSTQSFYNVDRDDPDGSKLKSLKSAGYYDAGQLFKEPYTCSLPSRNVTVTLDSAMPLHGGRCGAVPYLKGRVIIEGIGEYDLHLGGAGDHDGLCNYYRYTLIFVRGAQVQMCTANADPGSLLVGAALFGQSNGEDPNFECSHELKPSADKP